MFTGWVEFDVTMDHLQNRFKVKWSLWPQYRLYKNNDNFVLYNK